MTLSIEARKRIGEANSKGEQASYSAKHHWLYRNLGKADHCELDPMHTSKRFQWANLSHEYHRDPSDWAPLCQSCHQRYDLGQIAVRGLTLLERGGTPSVFKQRKNPIVIRATPLRKRNFGPPNYRTVQSRLVKQYGRPQACELCSAESGFFEWVCLDGCNSGNIADYAPLCRSCRCRYYMGLVWVRGKTITDYGRAPTMVHTPERAKHISVALKGHLVLQSTKDKLSKALKGRTKTTGWAK